jgi:hypothetical protein
MGKINLTTRENKQIRNKEESNTIKPTKWQELINAFKFSNQKTQIDRLDLKKWTPLAKTNITLK